MLKLTAKEQRALDRSKERWLFGGPLEPGQARPWNRHERRHLGSRVGRSNRRARRRMLAAHVPCGPKCKGESGSFAMQRRQREQAIERLRARGLT